MNKPTLGEFIRKRREELKLSQRALALQAGFKSIATLSDIEGGKRNPGPEYMEKLAEALKVSVQTLEEHDIRVPLQETKDLLEQRPEMVAAFRRVVNAAQSMSAEELIKRVSSPNPPSLPPSPNP